MASTPSRSLSSSLAPAAAEHVAHGPGRQHAQRGAVGPARETLLGDLDGEERAAGAGRQEDQQRGGPAVPALEQPAEERDGPHGDRLVAGGPVGEERGERAPGLVQAEAVREVDHREQRGLDGDRDQQGREHERPHDERAAVGADAGDLARLQARELWPERARRGAFGTPPRSSLGARF